MANSNSISQIVKTSFRRALGETLRAAMLRSVERGYWGIDVLDKEQRASALRFVQSANVQDLFNAARESGVSPITGMPYAPWIGWKGLDVTYAGGELREVASPSRKTNWKEYKWHQGDATQVWGHPLVPLFFLRSNVDPDKGFNDPDRNPYHGVHIAWSPLKAANYSPHLYLVAPVDEVLVHEYGCLGLVGMTLHRHPIDGAKGTFKAAWHILECHVLGFEQSEIAIEGALNFFECILKEDVPKEDAERLLELVRKVDSSMHTLRFDGLQELIELVETFEDRQRERLSLSLAELAIASLISDKKDALPVGPSYRNFDSSNKTVIGGVVSLLKNAKEIIAKKQRQLERFLALREKVASLTQDDILDLVQEGKIVIFGKAWEYYGDRAVYFMKPGSGDVGAIPFEEWRPVDAYTKIVGEIPYVMFHPAFDGNILGKLAYRPCVYNDEGLGVFNVGVVFDKYGVVVIDTREVDLGKFGQTEYVEDLFNWLSKYLAMARFGSVNGAMMKLRQRIQALLEYVEFCGGWEAIENVELLIRLAFVDFDFFSRRHKSMTLYEETVEVNGELRRVGVSFGEDDSWLSLTTFLTLYKQDGVVYTYFEISPSKSMYKSFNDLLRLYGQLSQSKQEVFRYFFEQVKRCIEEDDDDVGFQTEKEKRLRTRRQLVYESLAAVLVKLESEE